MPRSYEPPADDQEEQTARRERTENSDRSQGVSRRSVIGAMVGGAGLWSLLRPARGQQAELGSACTWTADQNADGNSLYGLGGLQFGSGDTIESIGTGLSVDAGALTTSRQLLELKRYAASSLPASDDAALVFDTTRGVPAWRDVDHWEWPTFVDDVLTSEVTVANTTTKTDVFTPGINAGSLVKGRTYQIDMFGQFSTANTSAQFQVDVDLAGTDVAGITNVGGNVSEAAWSIEFTYTVREDGSNGVISPHTTGLFNGSPDDARHNPVSVDTTQPSALDVSIQWDEADPGNSVTVEQAHLKQMA